jgi:hypothetical protein
VAALLSLLLVFVGFVPVTSSAHAHDTSLHAYDVAAKSVRAHTSEAALVASDEVSEGVQEGVSAAAGPLSVVFAKSGAANSVAVNGETAATALGRQTHAAWNYGPGYVREFRLPSGRRVDAINIETRTVIELKPNNPRAIKLGEKQVQDYVDELNSALQPGETPWTGSVVTYGAG